MNKAEKKWSGDAEKMKMFLLQEIEERGSEWRTLLERCLGDCQKHKILDVGCGTGFISLLLAKIGCDVIAIDNNIAMLKEAEKISEELGVSNKITFMLKDTEFVDFADNIFDAVVSRYAFWLFNNPKKVYAQWYRILKTGGCMLNLDANWLFLFWGEEQAKLFQSDENILTKCYGKFQDYYHDTDMMDELKKLPLSYVNRPEWDLKICREIGFKNIETETLSQGKYWNSFMARRYRTMPIFITKAQK